jgi:hypothetical protein
MAFPSLVTDDQSHLFAARVLHKICHTCEVCTVSISHKSDPPTEPALAAVQVCRVSASGLAVQSDVLAVEEPLEVRLGCDVGGRRVHRAVSATMRQASAIPAPRPEMRIALSVA